MSRQPWADLVRHRISRWMVAVDVAGVVAMFGALLWFVWSSDWTGAVAAVVALAFWRRLLVEDLRGLNRTSTHGGPT